MVGDPRDPGGPDAELTGADDAAEPLPHHTPEVTAGLRTGGRTAEVTASLRTGGGTAEVTSGLRAGYDAAARVWAEGPGLLYTRLAEALVAAAPVPLPGALVLDLGTGPGLAGRVALAAGARQVVGADLSLGMLRQAGTGHPDLRPVVADAVALPFRDRCFDLVLAAYLLNHLDSLEAGLAEARRVLRSGAALAASLFAPGWTHPAKDAIDDVLRSCGYRPPAWYTALQPGSRASDPDALAAAAAAAGFARVRVDTTTVTTGLATPAELVSWRLGMAQVVPFLDSLTPPERAALRRAAERAVTGAGPLVVSMLVLAAS